MKLRLIISVLLLVGLISALDRRMGVVPPLGRFFSPTFGAVAHLLIAEKISLKSFAGKLTAPVQVAIDAHGVPHIFAENDDDAYFVQGFLQAQDRLWQLDFQTRLATGRLSEIMGERTLPLDRFFVQLQLEEAADRAVEATRQDSETWNILKSFSEGINAYINTLKPRDYPLEYKMLDAKPELWSEKKSLLVSRLMAFRLSAMSKDIPRTRSALKLGFEKFADLFLQNPIKTVSTYNLPESLTADVAFKAMKQFWPVVGIQPNGQFKYNDLEVDGAGSNAWAVAGHRSKSGKALLASDPHLGYTLPSVWYPIHLQTPNMDVVGFTLAGSPGVVIGSTKKLSWAVTNGYADVMDWYSVKFRDTDQSEYWTANGWERTWQRTHLIKVRGHEPEEIVIRWTHLGPIVSVQGLPDFASNYAMGLSFRWMGHRPSNELRTFYQLNRGQSLEDCPDAIRHFVVPSQNFVCADFQGRVGVWLGGMIPIKPMGMGRWILTADEANHQWQGFLDHKYMPQNPDPANGQVFTANQRSIGQRFKFELGEEFPVGYRAETIERALTSIPKWDAEGFRRLQTSVSDNFLCEFKKFAVPLIKSAQLDVLKQTILPHLTEWNCRMHAESLSASVIYKWWEYVNATYWSQEIGDKQMYNWPDKTRTLAHLRALANTDNALVIKLLLSGFNQGIEDLVKIKGKNFAHWRWGEVQKAEVRHIARIPGLGRESTDVGGNSDTVSAHQGDGGPSMRMIVEMSTQPEVYMSFPGGRSGDPATAQFSDWFKGWVHGEMRKVSFIEGAQAARSKGLEILEFTP